MTQRHRFALGLLAAAVLWMVPPVVRGQQAEDKGGDKKYVKAAPMRADLKRRLAEQALEEYLPKVTALMKAFNPLELDSEMKYIGAVEEAYFAWSDVVSYQKTAGEPLPDEKEWSAEYTDFLQTLRTKGKRIVLWMSREALGIEGLNRSTENAPSKFKELKDSLVEADAVLSEAKAMMYGTWSREQIQAAPALLGRVKTAVNLASAVIPSLIDIRKYGQNVSAEKPSLGTEEQNILNSWKGLPDAPSKVLKSLRQIPKDWIPLVQARLEAKIKARDVLLKAYDPVLNGTVNSSCAYFKGNAWDYFVDAAKRDQSYLERKIVGQGQITYLTPQQQKEEDDLTKKERDRLAEINRLSNAEARRKLVLEVSDADSDGELKSAKAALAKFDADAAILSKEAAQIMEKHSQRRKKLGLPSAFDY